MYRFIFIWSFVFITLLVLVNPSTKGHEWYDKGCCSEQDCAPIIEKHRDIQGNWVVTTRHGTAIFSFSTRIRPSKDEKDHACMMPPFAPNDSNMIPLCLYFRVDM
jgi:hypothetical protein